MKDLVGLDLRASIENGFDACARLRRIVKMLAAENKLLHKMNQDLLSRLAEASDRKYLALTPALLRRQAE